MSMILIQRQVLSSSAASITFSNIPQNYKTLVLMSSARTSSSSGQVWARIDAAPNGSSTASASVRTLAGTGTAVVSGAGAAFSVGFAARNTATANTFGNSVAVFPNYNTSQAKVWSADGVTENNGSTALQELDAVLWSNSAAITSLVITNEYSETFLANSSFSLYGLSA